MRTERDLDYYLYGYIWLSRVNKRSMWVRTRCGTRNAIIYEVHVRSLYDSDGGIFGD